MFVEGMQLVLESGEWPDLALGDRISYEGKEATSLGQARIKVNGDSLIIHERGVAIEPQHVATLDESLESSLVTVSGVVTEIDNSTIFLDDTIPLLIKQGSGISKKDFKEGATYTVTGVVTQIREDYFVMPRSVDDITNTVFEEFTENAIVGSVAIEDIPFTPPQSSPARTLPLLAAGICLALITTFLWLRARSLSQHARSREDEYLLHKRLYDTS
jgi:hypothetical protein